MDKSGLIYLGCLRTSRKDWVTQTLSYTDVSRSQTQICFYTRLRELGNPKAMVQFQNPFQESREVRLRQLLIRERWPEMLKGCRACIHWDDFKRPECCGDCGIGDRRRQAVTEESPPSKSPGI